MKKMIPAAYKIKAYANGSKEWAAVQIFLQLQRHWESYTDACKN